jgi:hypothetical protein
MIPVIVQLIVNSIPILIQLAYIVYITYLIFMEIRNWFMSLRGLLSNKQYSAVSIKTTLKNGKKAIVQGVLNLAVNELEKSRTIVYDKLDDQLSGLHEQYDVVTYTS